MELENVSIVSNLGSSDVNRQMSSLMSLYHQSIDGKDVQSYISTIIQVKLKFINFQERFD
jgi:hypothetical protein